MRGSTSLIKGLFFRSDMEHLGRKILLCNVLKTAYFTVLKKYRENHSRFGDPFAFVSVPILRTNADFSSLRNA